MHQMGFRKHLDHVEKDDLMIGDILAIFVLNHLGHSQKRVLFTYSLLRGTKVYTESGEDEIDLTSTLNNSDSDQIDFYVTIGKSKISRCQ